jgi:hypothetical protein
MKHQQQQHSNATVYNDISPSKFAGTPMILGGSPNGTGGGSGGGGEYDIGDENSFLSKCSLLDSSVGQQEGVATATVEGKAVEEVENDGAPKTPYVVKRDTPTEDYHGEASSRDDDDESLFQFAALNESLMKRDDCPPGTTPKKKKTMGAVRIQVERSNNASSYVAAASPSPPPQTPFTQNKSNGGNNVKSIPSSMTNNNNTNVNDSVEVITTPQSVLHGLAITDEAVVELDEFVMATPSFKTPVLTTSTTSAAATTAATNNNITPPTTTTEVVTPRMFQSSPLLTPQLGDTSLSSDMKGLSFLETGEDFVQQQQQQLTQTAKKKGLNQRNSSPTSMFQSSPLNSDSPNDSILMQSMSSFIVHDTSAVVDGGSGGGDGAQRELFDSITSSGEEEERKDARKEANLVRGRALLSIASEDETDCDDDNGGGDDDKGDDEFENVSKLGVDFFKLPVNSGGGDKEVPAGEETTDTKMVESSFASPTGVTNFHHQDEDFTSSAAASPPTKTSSSSLISRWLDSAFGGCGSLESITCGSKNGDDGIEESSSSSSAAATAANVTTKNRQQKSWLPVTGGAPLSPSLNRPGLVQRDVSPAEELSMARQNANMTHQLYTNENKNFRVRG